MYPIELNKQADKEEKDGKIIRQERRAGAHTSAPSAVSFNPGLQVLARDHIKNVQ